jgi:urea transporter/murein DD-endopeptidase MepM/ murein hydrolase activator NlpD
MAVGYSLRLPYPTSGVNVYSSLLVGLSLGAYYTLNFNLVLLIVLSAALTVFLTAMLRSFLWQLGHLPVLSLPFVIVALTAALAASTYGGLDPYYEPAELPPALFGGSALIGSWFDSFFASLGSTFFSPHPVVGALLFVGVLLRSRYLAFLCLAGFLSGQAVYLALMTDPPAGLLAWTGFNFALTAMALGGIFSVPSASSFFVALFAAAASAVVSGALTRFLIVYNLPVMALPFLLTTLTVLAALRLRISLSPPILLLEQPGLPETNYERARLARARLGELGSVPVLAPFLGPWQVYQGFDGPHTHRGEWRFALDFHRIEDGRSFTNDGIRLEEYFCFGLPIYSPVYGTVVEAQDAFPDNPPGELDVTHNWGNHVVIQTDGGWYVLLAHLKQHSLGVTEGSRVTPNTRLAACGNSGRSPQPHLHLQVQRHPGPGGPTVPFHLVSSIVGTASEARYEVVVDVLEEGATVRRAEEDARLATALQLPVGRKLSYEFSDFSGATHTVDLVVEVTLLGQYRIRVGAASVAFERRNGALAFYDRSGPSNLFLDTYVLALGLTPLSAETPAWCDLPPAKLLPLTFWERAILGLVRPLGAGLASYYSRDWLSEQRQFVQRGRHCLELVGLKREIETEAVLDPACGCRSLSIVAGAQRASASLLRVAQIADAGIPAWEHEASNASAGARLPRSEGA